jgi:hypothetical protein
MSLLHRLKEAVLPNSRGEVLTERGSAPHTPFRDTLKEMAKEARLTEPPTGNIKPRIPFDQALAAYFADPAVKAAAHELAFSAVGKGFYHTVDPEYAKADEVAEVIDDFNVKANLDALAVVAAVEIAAFGNHIWLIGDVEKKSLLNSENPITPLPLAAIDSVTCRYLSNNVKVFSQPRSYNLLSIWGGAKLSPERLIHYRWNPVGGGPFGYGIVNSLLEEGKFDGETRLCYLEMKWRIEQQMLDIHEKYAGQDQLWWLKKAKPEDIKRLEALLRSRPKGGARFAFSGEQAEISTVSIDPRARFEYYVDHIMNQNYLGLETPLAKALTTPGFTEASIRGAIELHEPVIFTMQRFMKREIEQLWRLAIKEAEYDPKAAKARLNWGPPGAPDMEQLAALLPEVVKLRQLGDITGPQMREILRTVFNLKMIEEPEQIETEIPTNKKPVAAGG